MVLSSKLERATPSCPVEADKVVSVGCRRPGSEAAIHSCCHSANIECLRQFDSSDTGQIRQREHRAEHREPAEVLSQLDDTSNSPVYGEYKCC